MSGTLTAARVGRMSRRERRRRRMALELRNKNALLVCIVPVMIAAKIMVAYLLPAKYFYDNNRILGMANVTMGIAPADSVKEWEGSYRIASDLFVSLNVAGLETMLDWSICLGIILTALVTVLVLRADAPDFLQTVFILATVGLLNIYIFTIGKDVIQFAFFFAVYVVLMLPLDNTLVKMLASAAILYFESTFFREYYILIAALILVVYAVLTLFRRKRRALNFVSLMVIIAIFVASIYAILAVAQVIMPEEYQQVMTLRDYYSDGMDGNSDSATFIQNQVTGSGLPIFMVNYVINAFRMMVPIELAMRGVFYWPFCIFQIMVTAYMVNLIRQINRINEPVVFLALCIYIGYALASFIFEPDFGSWTRHEAATFPVLHLLVMNKYQRVPMTREERMLQGGDE